MPSVPTVYRWLNSKEEFRDLYARAKQDQLQILADELLPIADTPCEGVRTEISEKFGTKEIRYDMIEHRKIRIDTRKWLMAKLAPKKYGDRIEVDTGSDQINELMESLDRAHDRYKEENQKNG